MVRGRKPKTLGAFKRKGEGGSGHIPHYSLGLASLEKRGVNYMKREGKAKLSQKSRQHLGKEKKRVSVYYKRGLW